MNNKKFLTIHSAVYALFAIGLFVIPSILWPYYGLQLNDKYAVFLSQHTSIFLGGIAIIGFMLKNVEDKSDVAKQLMMSLLLTNILGVIVTLYACFTGIFYGLGWSDPAFFIFLSILSFLQWKRN
ncbi:hypothetical protein SAMN04487911_103145 [Arenibacter nanhaiticus]|uniref:Cytochrome C and Quinol oxidase polypeptide I n=1 Tax=Arenibacter nanhaiticus TaxID=558155 RepID=A0A1M6CB81_9FLAO|nr:hypothetical protein [Arenibacter nanhaiticus]SHI58257.1 hypothetical protein SAMN04487911_103145 [Arenibacter nanhaiticus]